MRTLRARAGPRGSDERGPRERGSRRLAGRALGRALAASLVLGCSPFEATVPVGPPDGVIGRAAGPAASVATAGASALVAFAARPGADERDRLWVARWTPEQVGAAAPVGAPVERPGPPAILVDRGRFLIAWREATGDGGRRLAWSEIAGSDGSDALADAAAGVLVDEVAADPRGGGAPPAVLAAIGPAPRPGGPLATPLAAWLRSGSGSGADWERLEAGRGRPLGYEILGLPAELGARALAATLDESGGLVLQRLGELAASGSGAPPARLAAQPAGPRPVWLALARGAIVAGWSEFRAGAAGNAAVRVARSPDGGRTWSEPRALFASPLGFHPMAAFASDESTLAAIWREPATGGPRVMLALSRDGGETFSKPVAVDGGGAIAERSVPAVALQGSTVLAAWVERTDDGATSIRGSLSRDGGATFSPRAERLDGESTGRVVGNPLPWLLPGGAGGVLWESRAPAASATPATAASLARAAEPARLSLHLRALDA